MQAGGNQQARHNRTMHALKAGLLAFGAIVLALETHGSAQADLLNQARRLDLEGKQEAAITLYQQALDRAPNSFDAHYGIARALDLVDRYDEARLHFSKAIDLAPEG